MKKIAIVVALLVVAIILLGWRMRPDPLQVWVTKAEFGAVEQTVSNTRAGTIKACRRSKLSMPLGGVVDKLLVQKGDRVEPGQLLLELWDRDHHAEVQQAQAALNSAKHSQQQVCVMAQRSERESLRLQTLAERKLVSIDAADNAQSNALAQQGACAAAQSQIASAEAQLATQQAVLERFQLRAPFAGVVAEINGELGEYVTPSPPGVATPPAVDLIDTSCLYATAPIDEVDAAALRLGMPVKITLDAFRDRQFSGKLTRIAPYVLDLEKQARTVDVDVRFDEVPQDVILLIGYSADVTIVLKNVERVLRVPTEALVNTDNVWVLDTKKETINKHKLQLGIGNFTFTEVRSGLQEGELVVRSPDQPGIKEGVRAEIKHE
ncbi:MAG TPA: efflux RND transporter periplasmic adaptor subunit [Spongiibacteraceae bacterium]|nr:efflux RND transporter periplasmic adaptor subunit [Spongiibacteraceae bacterium]